MKYLISISRFKKVLMISILITSSFTGCKKLLDTDRQGGYDASNFPYPGGSGPYDQFIFAAYNDLRSFNVHSQAFISATSIRSDDADKGSTPADGGANAIDMDNFPVAPSNGFINALWIGYYSLISNCNSSIKEVNTNTQVSSTSAVKVQTIAEARFLRAYAYFNLVRFFGKVPLIDTFYTDPAAQNNVPQVPATQTYAFIESDLQFAAANLPAAWDAKFVGRATKGAANGLLAKVYLIQQKWALALAAAGQVVNSGLYSLISYDVLFREEGENSKESVFEVQATASAAIPQNNGVQYAQIQGVRGSGQWDLGWGWNSPSDNLATTAYEAGDPRRARTILFTSTSTVPGPTIYGEVTPVGLPNPRYNNKVYTNPAMRASIGNRFGYWFNLRVLRYADVLLMYAEAANELGNTTEAIEKLELVRARARAGNNTILPAVTTTNQVTLRDAIRRERRVELAMEHDRFWDIVRWGTAQAVLNGVGKTNFNASRDVLLPIPQTQIDLSKGVLVQNPGY